VSALTHVYPSLRQKKAGNEAGAQLLSQSNLSMWRLLNEICNRILVKLVGKTGSNDSFSGKDFTEIR